jgi:CRISPR system Cascade subunit CasB
MTMPDHPQPHWGQIARRWWEMLQNTRKDGTPNPARDPGALARLRRAATPVVALEEPNVFDLYKKLGFGRGDVDRRLPRVAAAAAVLAHIRTDAMPGDNGFRRRFAEMLGRGGDRPLMSPLRFKRLLTATEDQDLLIAFRRAVALAGGRNIDVGDVAASLLDWSERRRMGWAFDYYGAGIAAPKQNGTASTDDKD